MSSHWKTIIVGSGPSGSFFAKILQTAGRECLMLEAGRDWARNEYPRREVEAASQLYWGGGIELTQDARMGLLRPKVVGGGSVINQALMDRFDDSVWEDWKEKTSLEEFSTSAMTPWYEEVESQLSIQKISEKYWNGNAKLFRLGMERNGFRWAPLERAQKDCPYDEGQDCIECLNGCRLGCKQSMPETVLREARALGLTLWDNTQVIAIDETSGLVKLQILREGQKEEISCESLVLAAGAIGNTGILLRSQWKSKVPELGQGFFTHPQEMVMGRYGEPVDAHRGPFQSVKSDEPRFREQGFKLENVFALPASVAMLLPGFGVSHQRLMERINDFACMEVAVRDTEPGVLSLDSSGKMVIHKTLNGEDRKRRALGLSTIREIFESTGALEILPGGISIGLHLMGGCGLGKVVDRDFRLKSSERIWLADSSVFPSAPGINPSLSIMAISTMASRKMLSATGG